MDDIRPWPGSSGMPRWALQAAAEQGLLRDTLPLPVITYGRNFTFRTNGGSTCTVSVDGCVNMEEADNAIRQMAYALGYQPPKWWQWWRWSEPTLSPPPHQIVNEGRE